nr:hypothetical protein CFP56_23659 [Quercus suber]
MALGRAHNVITDDELRGISSIPSHELVNRHIHKLVQVLGESPSLTTDYLTSEEKVVANSKVNSVEAKSSRLRKDLIVAMDQATKAKEKVKELKDALKVEKKLVIQKDEEVQVALLKTGEEWIMRYHSQVADFANLGFKAINTKILANETKEKEGEAVTNAAEGDGAVERDDIVVGGTVDEVHMDKGCVEKVVTAP